MKRTICMLLALLMALSLCACGSKPASAEEAPAQEPAAGNEAPAEEEGAPEEPESPAEPEESAETLPAGVASLKEAEARLISSYQTAENTFVMFAYQRPCSYQEEFSWRDSPYHEVSQHFVVNGLAEGIRPYFYYQDDWKVVFAQAEGLWNAEDIVLYVTDYDEDPDLTIEYSFTAADMVAPEEYERFGLHRMGSRYVTVGEGTLSQDYNSSTDRFCNLSVKLTDVALRDQDNRLQEEDVSLESFRLYAGDGTSAEEFFGTPCVASLSRFSNDDYMTTARVFLDFYPTQTGGTQEQQKAIVQEMIDSLLETEPYFTYTDEQGNVFTYPVSD